MEFCFFLDQNKHVTFTEVYDFRGILSFKIMIGKINEAIKWPCISCTFLFKFPEKLVDATCL